MESGLPAGEDLVARFRGSLSDKLNELALSWERWLAEPDATPAKAAYQLLVHRLAGSAPSYGMDDLGRQALRVDELLAVWDAEVEALRPPLSDLCKDVSGPAEALLRVLGRAARERANTRASAEPAATSVPNLYVVLVEDDPDQAALWREALAHEGLRVRTVTDHHALQAELVLEVPDVLLVDFWLEPHTGVELVRLLRDVPAFSSVIKVCLTADSGPVPRQAAMDAGFAAVLRKTLAPADLADLLRQIVAASRRR